MRPSGAFGIAAVHQFAGDQIHLFPVVMQKNMGRDRAGLKPDQPGPDTYLAVLIQGARQHFLLDARRAAGHLLPSAVVIKLMEGHRGFKVH